VCLAGLMSSEGLNYFVANMKFIWHVVYLPPIYKSRLSGIVLYCIVLYSQFVYGRHLDLISDRMWAVSRVFFLLLSAIIKPSITITSLLIVYRVIFNYSNTKAYNSSRSFYGW